MKPTVVAFTLVLVATSVTGVKLDPKRRKKASEILERRHGHFAHGIKAALLEQTEIYKGAGPPPPPPPPGATIEEWRAYGSAWLNHPLGKRFCWTSLLVSLTFASAATLSYAAR